MSLAQHVSALIDQDLEQLRKVQLKQLHDLNLQQETQLREARSQYQEQISNAVEQQVNLQHYQAKQATAFDYATELQQRLQQAYQQNAAALLQSHFGSDALKTVMHGIPVSTPITVFGEHAPLLTSLLQQHGFTTIQQETGEGLGGLRFESGHIAGDFTVEDFLESVKKKTLNQLMSALS